MTCDKEVEYLHAQLSMFTFCCGEQEGRGFLLFTAPALKKWGYIGFSLTVISSVIILVPFNI